MLKNKFILAFILLASPMMLMAAQKEHQAAHELFEVMQFEKMMDDSLNTTIENLKQVNPNLENIEAPLREFYNKYLNKEILSKELINLYEEVFTENEIKDITAFYKTKTGQKTLEKLPVMMQKAGLIVQNKMMQNLDELQKIIEGELEKAVISGLKEGEANQLIVSLYQSGISASKIAEGDQWSVQVSKEDYDTALTLLEAQKKARDEGMIPSEAFEKRRFIEGVQSHMAQWIQNNIDGICEVQLKINLPDEGEATATLHVTHSGVLDDPDSPLMAEIKKIVSTSVIGLKPDRVEVNAERVL